MQKNIDILMTNLIFISQPIKAEEINIDPQMKKLSMLTKKLNHIIGCIDKELKGTKEFQITQWEKAKNQNIKNLKIVQHKLTGFFSDFPTSKQEDK